MEQNIAQVALSAANYAIDRPYSYRVPVELKEHVCPGMRVLVPFGSGNRRTDGVVLQVSTMETEKKLKDILSVLDEVPMLEPEELHLALWMRERYFCTVYEAIRTMLPAGLWFSIKDCWKIAPGIDREAAYEAAGRSENARHLVEMLFSNEGSAELEQIRAAFGVKDPMPSIRSLAEKGILIQETHTERGVGDKTELVAELSMPPEEALEQLSSKRARAPIQYSVMELLCTLGRCSSKELCYFTGATLSTLRALEKKGFLTLDRCEVLRSASDAYDASRKAQPIVLNEGQMRAFEGLRALVDEKKPAASLLYGVTGSGKTQVYLQLIHHVLEQGRTALVLVPEIALTPQLMQLFISHFGRQVAVLHSSLSAGARYDEWKRAKRGEARVVVGTRSAVFAPLPDLGLIILDEEQEGTYKSEQVPRYHARDVAKYRCVHANALLLLGSATPSVETMYQAREGGYHFFTLPERYNTQALPSVDIVDLKEELKNGNGGSISRPLREAISENLQRGEQTILFINRRGASKMVTCGECGHVPECPNCSVHLTYHSANRRLMCHYCGHSQPLPEDCPECGGMLTFVGAGTQKVQEELEACFPGTEILRMDADTINATQTHEKLLSRFRRENIPILVGTQMVAKGLDFENVTLVGVIAADLSLYLDNYRAGERTFSLLTQVVGRAGRGSKSGRAMIQTWTPENDVICCSARQDYDSFYEQEIEMRRLCGYPPFRHVYQITVTGIDEEQVLFCCLRIKQALQGTLDLLEYREFDCRLLGPASAPVAKVNNRYRYRVTLMAPDHKKIRTLVAHLVRSAQKDKENRGVSVFADLDPQD